MTGKSAIVDSAQTRHRTFVLRSAVTSRIALIALTIIWRSIVSPYDTSASINPNCLISATNATSSHHHNHNGDVLFPRIASAIENGVVWDSVYFVRIAQCGYEYEQSYAFLPLLPICIYILSRTVFAPLIPLVGYRAVLVISGYVINNIAFVFAALFLYRLSVLVLKDSEAALRASVLFCFNPASIFYSSIYTESLYALLSLGGLYYYLSGASNLAVIWFALSGSARSNGVLNAGYIGFQTMHWAYDALFLKNNACFGVQVLIAGILRCIFICIPFVAFQAYGYYNMCLGFPNEVRPWCNARLPLLYNFIQSHYWGVGFLKYFQLKQLPNFLLALPILSVSLFSIIYYVKLSPEVFFSLGFRASPMNDRSSAILYSPGEDTKSKEAHSPEMKSSAIAQEDQALRQRKHTIKEEGYALSSTNNDSTDKLRYLSIAVLPFVLHLSFMAVTAFFVMHVQVATRFLSVSPPIYWFASYMMVSPSISKRWGYLIWGYCAAYILLGSLLFSNFYPFT